MLSERLQTTLHKKKSTVIFSGDNAQEKMLCKIVLILLGKHCTAENPMQCCPRSSRQNCIKNPVQCCLNTLWTTLYSKNPMQCCPRGPRQFCIRKMFHSMLTAYAILVLCNVVPEVPSNISQEKVQTI